ncbi:MAG: hypothetical protein ACRD0A_01835 [Acidimicrobiales bacterium]
MSEAFTPPEPGAPSDYTTLVEILAELAEDGFVENFTVTPNGKIRCSRCGHVDDPADMSMVAIRRLEGASDPDDMVAALALVCPDCGAKGTVVVKYGPGSTEAEQAVLDAVEDDRPS